MSSIAEPGLAPTAVSGRITNLDTVRGVATLGILAMNAVSFGLVDAAYFNLDAGGTETGLDWAVGLVGEIFVDQKMMALFSLLFGVGIVIFAERAEAKGRHAVWLSLWRNTLLLILGLLHTVVWDGDILATYALCSPVVLALRRCHPRTLAVLGTAMVLASAVLAVATQLTLSGDGDGLGGYWYVGGAMSDGVGLFLLSDFFLRALGMMLIGVALYRLDIVQGHRPAAFYRRMTIVGLGVGLPIAVAGVMLQVVADFNVDVAVIGEAPNTIATIPVALGYLALITLWNQRPTTGAHERIRAVGRMALTNYLAQTVIGVMILRVMLDRGDLDRAAIAVFVLVVWALQLAWSKAWLDRFRFGPVEWAWRVGTYRHFEPLRRA